MIEHSTVAVRGANLHVARAGRGRPLLLLHGWPEFWLTWEPVMTRLANRFDLIAPDLANTEIFCIGMREIETAYARPGMHRERFR